MGFRPDDERLRDALEIAEREGLDYTFEKTTLGDDAHPNTVRITLERGDRHAVMTGVVARRGTRPRHRDRRLPRRGHRATITPSCSSPRT